VDATYGDGLAEAFARVIDLPPERSDNHGRAERVDAFATGGTLLDVGSGLAVFPHAMKLRGWNCTALDPDPRAAAHARDVVGVDALCTDYLETDSALGRFDLVTLNKVLEHVPDPIAMLAHARLHADRAYVEVPDGQTALADGPGREELFVEHLHAFSATSLAVAIDRSGWTLRRLERLREPSSKYTLYAFVEARP
jgi:hypothetical protein